MGNASFVLAKLLRPTMLCFLPTHKIIVLLGKKKVTISHEKVMLQKDTQKQQQSSLFN